MQMSLTFKYITTFALFLCYFAYGVNFYVVGPTLIELAGLFQTTIEKICLIYTVRSGGYTLGSLSGFLFKYINRQLMFVFFLSLMGVTLAVMPHCTELWQVFALAGINGFSIGTFDTAINVWILEIWGTQSGPFMQALHFTYGLGSFVAPLICEPFLSTESIHSGGHGIPHSEVVVTSTAGPLVPTTVSSLLNHRESSDVIVVNGTEVDTLQSIDPIDFLIYVPYAIAGVVTVLSAMTVLALYYIKKYESPKAEKKPKPVILNDNGEVIGETLMQYLRRKSPSFLTSWMVLLGSLFLTFFVGMEQMHLQFLPTFVVNTELAISPSTAAMMSSAAALSFTLGRCVSIPLAIKLKPQTILYTNHVLMLTGTFILAIYANTSETMLWIGNCILGAGFSSVYASAYAFIECQITVTNRIGSIFVFAGGLTAALSPSVVGQYIEANPLILVWFNLVCCLLCFAILVIIHLTVYISAKKNEAKEYHIARNKETDILATNQMLLINAAADDIVVVHAVDREESKDDLDEKVPMAP